MDTIYSTWEARRIPSSNTTHNHMIGGDRKQEVLLSLFSFSSVSLPTKEDGIPTGSVEQQVFPQSLIIISFPTVACEWMHAPLSIRRPDGLQHAPVHIDQNLRVTMNTWEGTLPKTDDKGSKQWISAPIWVAPGWPCLAYLQQEPGQPYTFLISVVQ